MSERHLVWGAVSYGSGALAMLAVRRGLSAAWSRRRSEPPPEGPRAAVAPLPAALTWAVAAGVGVAVARLVAIRSAARVWEAATDEPPPVEA